MDKEEQTVKVELEGKKATFYARADRKHIYATVAIYGEEYAIFTPATEHMTPYAVSLLIDVLREASRFTDILNGNFGGSE